MMLHQSESNAPDVNDALAAFTFAISAARSMAGSFETGSSLRGFSGFA
jgi:hypothetical protein